MTLGRAFLALLLIGLLGTVWLARLVEQGRVPVPERLNPFTPLDVAAPLGPLTGWKFWRASGDARACMAALASAGMRFTPVADTTSSNGCDVRDAVRVSAFADAGLNHPFLASCPLALGLAMAERHGWQPAAESTEHAHITRIDHVGSYACRNINHATQGNLSEHAHANAIDIEDFVLSNGRRITIGGDWGKPTAAGTFLAQAHAGACRFFHVVLGPDYNALHQSHFHLDMGPYRTCR
ncbi:extensin family protein [Robbsia sp. KACC 23696]|uniref:extensin-like domain-containing protein n=1 Tax=Robbsia sp. KACC 23696 TaxID=3149231 RepID=UPI00325A9259